MLFSREYHYADKVGFSPKYSGGAPLLNKFAVTETLLTRCGIEEKVKVTRDLNTLVQDGKEKQRAPPACRVPPELPFIFIINLPGLLKEDAGIVNKI